MSQDIVPEIGSQELDPILKFLDIFSQEGYEFGEWVAISGHLPYFSYHPEVRAFIAALYKEKVIIPFDWMSWSDEARRYQLDSEALARANLLTLRKLLTTHVRTDRINEGHFAAMLESAHIVAILRRLKEIRAVSR